MRPRLYLEQLPLKPESAIIGKKRIICHRITMKFAKETSKNTVKEVGTSPILRTYTLPGRISSTKYSRTQRMPCRVANRPVRLDLSTSNFMPAASKFGTMALLSLRKMLLASVVSVKAPRQGTTPKLASLVSASNPFMPILFFPAFTPAVNISRYGDS